MNEMQRTLEEIKEAMEVLKPLVLALEQLGEVLEALRANERHRLVVAVERVKKAVEACKDIETSDPTPSSDEDVRMKEASFQQLRFMAHMLTDPNPHPERIRLLNVVKKELARRTEVPDVVPMDSQESSSLEVEEQVTVLREDRLLRALRLGGEVLPKTDEEISRWIKQWQLKPSPQLIKKLRGTLEVEMPEE